MAARNSPGNSFLLAAGSAQPAVQVVVLHAPAAQDFIVAADLVEIAAVADHRAEIVERRGAGAEEGSGCEPRAQPGRQIADQADVGIDENEPGCAARLGAEVARARYAKAFVVGHAHCLDRRMVLLHPVAGLLRAAVIDHDHFAVFLPCQQRQGLLEVLKTSLAGGDK